MPKLNPIKRRTISIRIPIEVINDSKSVPGFRKELELYAIGLWKNWKVKQNE
jgi:hypothetical protein